MATVTKPIALDESLNTTELAPRNVADVLAEELAKISGAISHIALPTTYDELSDLEDVNITSPTNGQYLQYDSVTQKWKNVNGGGGGGDSVAWSQIVTTGTKIAEITINGTTTDVYAPQGGGTFSATIIVTTTTGLTVTATKGAGSYTATETSSGTYEVTVDSIGTWTISDGSNTDTVNVTAQTTYYVTLTSIPDGSTVTPTDVIQTWLNCANIWDKAYTTIGEVLADSTTLSALISSNNAVDYLVRSTTWANSVCADSSAMTYIGLNNYASNTLLADSTWRSAIKSSAYYDNVANDKIPTMSDNTTPSGVASVYATGNSDLHAYTDGTNIEVSSQTALEPYAYRALLSSTTFRYNGVEKGSVSNDTISVTYEFDTTTVLEISVDQFYMLKSSLPSISGTFKISVRNHTTQAWTDLFTDVVSGSTARVDHQGKLYDGYFTDADAIKIELSSSTSWGIGFGGLQFKGRKDI